MATPKKTSRSASKKKTAKKKAVEIIGVTSRDKLEEKAIQERLLDKETIQISKKRKLAKVKTEEIKQETVVLEEQVNKVFIYIIYCFKLKILKLFRYQELQQ